MAAIMQVVTALYIFFSLFSNRNDRWAHRCTFFIIFFPIRTYQQKVLFFLAGYIRRLLNCGRLFVATRGDNSRKYLHCIYFETGSNIS